MKNKMICINTIEKVKNFVSIVSNYDADFDLISGKYVIDGKSIMGIFSLDLSKPIELRVDAFGNSSLENTIWEALNSFVVK